MKITKQIYKRLTIVLAIPLLLLGTYLAENKLFQDTDMLQCNDSGGFFSCYPTSPDVPKYSGLFINSVRIFGGMSEDIVTNGENVMGFRNGKMEEIEVRNKDIHKRLTVAKNRDDGYCTLSQYANNADLWAVTCVPQGMTEVFHFADKNVAEKYKKLFIQTQAESEKRHNSNKIGFVFAVLTPLLTYLALSLAILLLMKIVRYVIHGDQKTA